MVKCIWRDKGYLKDMFSKQQSLWVHFPDLGKWHLKMEFRIGWEQSEDMMEGKHANYYFVLFGFGFEFFEAWDI